MSQGQSWVQFLQWVQRGCSAVPAAAAQAQLRHRGTFSRKSSTRRRGEGTALSDQFWSTGMAARICSLDWCQVERTTPHLFSGEFGELCFAAYGVCWDINA